MIVGFEADIVRPQDDGSQQTANRQPPSYAPPCATHFESSLKPGLIWGACAVRCASEQNLSTCLLRRTADALGRLRMTGGARSFVPPYADLPADSLLRASPRLAELSVPLFFRYPCFDRCPRYYPESWYRTTGRKITDIRPAAPRSIRPAESATLELLRPFRSQYPDHSGAAGINGTVDCQNRRAGSSGPRRLAPAAAGVSGERGTCAAPRSLGTGLRERTEPYFAGKFRCCRGAVPLQSPSIDFGAANSRSPNSSSPTHSPHVPAFYQELRC